MDQNEQLKSINQKLIERAIQSDAPQTQRNKRNSLRTSLNYLYENAGVKYLLDYDFDDMEDLFIWINTNKQIRKKSKTRYRYHLKAVFLYAVTKQLHENGNNDQSKIAFWTYIFSDAFYKFKETGSKRIILMLTPDDIRSFLQELLESSREDYIWFGILVYSGCRVGGLANLIVKNINFELATFQTQEKPTAASSGFNTYYLPRFFVDHLYTYILTRRLTENDKIVGITEKSIRHRMKKYREEWWPHLLRHTLRSCWAQKGMKPIYAKFLLNHEPETVDEHYQQSLNNPAELRAEYDRCYPY